MFCLTDNAVQAVYVSTQQYLKLSVHLGDSTVESSNNSIAFPSANARGIGKRNGNHCMHDRI